MRLPRLRELDTAMLAGGVERRQFDWRNGNLLFRVIYLRDVGDSFGPDPEASRLAGTQVYPYGVLEFIHADSPFSFTKFIDPDFAMSAYMGDDYAQLLALIGEGKGGPSFKPSEFFQAFADRIPQTLNLTRAVRPQDLRPPRDVEESEKRYFLYTRRHPNGPTPQNQRKTRMMLGDHMAAYCLRHGLSTHWSDVPVHNWSTEEIIRRYGSDD